MSNKNHNYDGWLTKQEAAASLGLAEKTLDRMAESGKIQKGKRKRAGLPAIAVFHPDDVARIKAERGQEQPEPFLLPADGTARELQPAAQQQTTTALVQALTAIAERVTAPAELKEPFFLTLKQAREVSGLPTSYLRQHFIAVGRAVKTGRGWRIRRADLEQFGRDGHMSNVSDMSKKTLTQGA
jgi:hypothetical protein